MEHLPSSLSSDVGFRWCQVQEIYANAVVTEHGVAQAPSTAAEHWEGALRGGFGKTLTFGTLLRIELSSQKHCNFFRLSNSWVWCLPSTEIKPFRFFFSVIKLASASQIGNLLPELFSNTVLLAKPDVSVSSTPEGPVYIDFIFTASFLGGRPAGEQKDSCPAVPGCACVCVSLCSRLCVSIPVCVCFHMQIVVSWSLVCRYNDGAAGCLAVSYLFIVREVDSFARFSGWESKETIYCQQD